MPNGSGPQHGDGSRRDRCAPLRHYPAAQRYPAAATGRTWLPIWRTALVNSRTEHYCGEIFLPNGSALDDGLLEDEAVLIALWNNAAFQELLTEIGIAQGDLVQAGLLPNPEVVYFFPVTDKPYKYLVDFPIEALWLRPIRIAAAEAESYRVCQRLSQAGLDLIRDVRQAYADVLLAEGRLRVGQEAIQLRQKIADLAQVRLEAGDISAENWPPPGLTCWPPSRMSSACRTTCACSRRLLNLLGLGLERPPLKLESPPTPATDDLNANMLADEAIATRPDALAAAENAAAAAAAACGWRRRGGSVC